MLMHVYDWLYIIMTTRKTEFQCEGVIFFAFSIYYKRGASAAVNTTRNARKITSTAVNIFYD